MDIGYWIFFLFQDDSNTQYRIPNTQYLISNIVYPTVKGLTAFIKFPSSKVNHTQFFILTPTVYNRYASIFSP